jgi:hypothetical protein
MRENGAARIRSGVFWNLEIEPALPSFYTYISPPQHHCAPLVMPPEPFLLMLPVLEDQLSSCKHALQSPFMQNTKTLYHTANTVPMECITIKAPIEGFRFTQAMQPAIAFLPYLLSFSWQKLSRHQYGPFLPVPYEANTSNMRLWMHHTITIHEKFCPECFACHSFPVTWTVCPFDDFATFPSTSL